MHAFSNNYLRDDAHRGRLLDRGFWVHGLPRLIPMCRLLGHRAVVDGYDSQHSADRARWVACSRCGVRPDPQGRLDPDAWPLGDVYTGPRGAPPPPKYPERVATKSLQGTFFPPGPWPTAPTGVVGGQVIIGRHGLLGAGVKIGNAGSEHTLAAHLYLSPLFGISVHTESFGQCLQRRLVPTGWQSRVIDIGATPGHLYWRLWAKRDEHSRSDPWWMHGSIRVDPRDLLLGEKRYSYEDTGDPITATVRMPHGDDHEVTLQLQRRTHGRRHGRKQKTWTVDWDCRDGIPTKPGDHGHVYGSAVPVSDAAVEARTWPAEATAAIATRLTINRARYGYQALATVTRASNG